MAVLVFDSKLSFLDQEMMWLVGSHWVERALTSLYFRAFELSRFGLERLTDTGNSAIVKGFL